MFFKNIFLVKSKLKSNFILQKDIFIIKFVPTHILYGEFIFSRCRVYNKPSNAEVYIWTWH